jgi:hypothetical protein
MANALYPKFKQKIIGASTLSTGTPIDLATNTIKLALIDTGVYTYNSADEFWSAASSALVGTAQTLASKTVTNGVFDAADVTFTSVTGSTIEALIIYKDNGPSNTSPLIAYIDTIGTGPISVTPNGGNIQVQFDASGIFSL